MHDGDDDDDRLKFEATDIPPVVLSEFESSCAKIGIKVLASGAVEDDVKYFMYCRADVCRHVSY